MKRLSKLILFYSIILVFYCNSVNAEMSLGSLTSNPLSNHLIINTHNVPPVAVNDTFIFLVGCGNNQFSGNILANDYDPDGDEIILYFSNSPKNGIFLIEKNGDFIVTVPDTCLGVKKFEYFITEISDKEYKSAAEVIFYIKSDYDCDNIADDEDLDDDNDGIPDTVEGNGKIDFDKDGIVDSYDIDSDNDGITDNVEWQGEDSYQILNQKDINKNGWDDAYDNSIGGSFKKAVDTDNDGMPDYIDNDSDKDGINDFIEAFGLNIEGVRNIFPDEKDSDMDGLDNTFDIVNGRMDSCNSFGSNAPLPDSNNNGVRNWRESQNNLIDNSLGNISILIFPNPSVGEINISCPVLNEEERIFFSLYNTNGTLVLNKTSTINHFRIELSDIRNGTYIAKIESERFKHTQPLIVGN